MSERVISGHFCAYRQCAAENVDPGSTSERPPTEAASGALVGHGRRYQGTLSIRSARDGSRRRLFLVFVSQSVSRTDRKSPGWGLIGWGSILGTAANRDAIPKADFALWLKVAFHPRRTKIRSSPPFRPERSRRASCRLAPVFRWRSAGSPRETCTWRHIRGIGALVRQPSFPSPRRRGYATRAVTPYRKKSFLCCRSIKKGRAVGFC